MMSHQRATRACELDRDAEVERFLRAPGEEKSLGVGGLLPVKLLASKLFLQCGTKKQIIVSETIFPAIWVL